ncbi:MAG: N-acetylmuramoyl-L-alanine amidase [Flavobacteriales bacterium]|nr:N-acetylmuramoyl-L-alanine amidase [Flavobacteriales bacterium]
MPKLTKIFKIDLDKTIMMKGKLLALLIAILITKGSIAQSKEDFFGKLRTVVIDAGHGGKDPGSLGKNSKEKDIALAVSLKLGNYLEEKYPDLNVIFTRKTDVFVDLQERASIANRSKADLFICIHANAGSSAAFGTETYVMGNAKTDANMRAAQRENAVILMEDNYEEKYENFNPYSPESYIAMSITQSAFQSQSIVFAEKIQAQFRERVNRKDRGVKMEHFLVLHQTTMPSVLVETGFITNLEEEKFLMSELGQDYLASAVYRAFKDYKEEIESKSRSMIEEAIEETVVVDRKKNAVKEETKKGTKPKKNKKKEDKPVVRKELNEFDKAPKAEGLLFKVQIATTTKKIKTTPENFNGLEGVSFYEAGGLYRYTYGAEDDWESANKLQQKVKENGFKDAFVVAFHNGKRIAVGEAVKLLKKDK